MMEDKTPPQKETVASDLANQYINKRSQNNSSNPTQQSMPNQENNSSNPTQQSMPNQENNILWTKLKDTLEKQSEDDYREIVRDIYDDAHEQLMSQKEEKRDRKKKLYKFITIFLIAQYIILIFFMLISNINNSCIKLSDNLLTTYIVSVFAETLAGLVAIIKFSFDDSQETEVLKILGNIVAEYKKYKSDK